MAIAAWLSGAGAHGFIQRLPGADNMPKKVRKLRPNVFPGELTTSDGVPADIPGDWPGFRGVRHDNISTERVPLARRWPKSGPKVLWSVDLGDGYAGAAVRNGRVYVLDYDKPKQADTLRCLSLADGREIWRRSYPVPIRWNHGMSRTVPAVTDKYVVTLGPKCHVMCTDASTGEFLWGIDLVNEYGTDIPLWYAGQCPIIDAGRAIIAPGGDALMIAVDCATGKVVWKTPNPKRWKMTHSSIRPVEFAGRRMYVYCAGKGVVGVDAESGDLLWQTTKWWIQTNSPTPVPVGGGRMFLTGAYGAGAMMLQLRRQGNRITAEPTYRLKPGVFSSGQQTPVFHDGHIFGVLPQKVGELSQQLVCLGTDGKVVWSSGRENRFGPKGLGPCLVADGMIIVLDDDGVLTLVEASKDGYRQLAQAKVLPGPEAWGPMAIADGRLIVRDIRKMVCLDLRAR